MFCLIFVHRRETIRSRTRPASGDFTQSLCFWMKRAHSGPISFLLLFVSAFQLHPFVRRQWNFVVANNSAKSLTKFTMYIPSHCVDKSSLLLLLRRRFSACSFQNYYRKLRCSHGCCMSASNARTHSHSLLCSSFSVKRFHRFSAAIRCAHILGMTMRCDNRIYRHD